MANNKRKRPLKYKEKVKPFENGEFRGIVAKKIEPEEKIKPFQDAEFRKPSLDAGTLLDRRRFEENLIRFGLLGKITTVSASSAGATIVIGTPGTSCYWDLEGSDVWYKDGDVYTTYNIIASGNLTGTRGIFTQGDGTAALTVTSETEIDHLNAHLLQGKHLSEISAVWSSIASNPQAGEYRIKAMRLDSAKNIVIMYEDVPEVGIASYATILSNPGSGEYRIKALRLDSAMRIVVLYDGVAES